MNRDKMIEALADAICAAILGKTATRGGMDAAAAVLDLLLECEAEIDQYIRQEYPGDHPVHERYRQRDFSVNPARIALAQLKETKT